MDTPASRASLCESAQAARLAKQVGKRLGKPLGKPLGGSGASPYQGSNDSP
jgi:hypothetical protein